MKGNHKGVYEPMKIPYSNSYQKNRQQKDVSKLLKTQHNDKKEPISYPMTIGNIHQL